MSKKIYNIGREEKPKPHPVKNTNSGREAKRQEYKYTEKYERFDNPIQEIYEATERALRNIMVFPQDPNHEPFFVTPENQNLEDGYVNYFKTIRVDTGEFGRIIADDNTDNEEVAFPACFIRFVDIRWLVQQQRIGEGRAVMRIRYILNNLNSTDPYVETMPFRLQQLINRAIQYAKRYEPSYDERISLKFADMPETTGVLQPYWIDYEIWFRDTSSDRLLDYTKRYVVVPPFTNHSDSPETNENNHENHKDTTYEDVVSIISKE